MKNYEFNELDFIPRKLSMIISLLTERQKVVSYIVKMIWTLPLFLHPGEPLYFGSKSLESFYVESKRPRTVLLWVKSVRTVGSKFIEPLYVVSKWLEPVVLWVTSPRTVLLWVKMARTVLLWVKRARTVLQ